MIVLPRAWYQSCARCFPESTVTEGLDSTKALSSAPLCSLRYMHYTGSTLIDPLKSESVEAEYF